MKSRLFSSPLVFPLYINFSLFKSETNSLPSFEFPNLFSVSIGFSNLRTSTASSLSSDDLLLFIFAQTEKEKWSNWQKLPKAPKAGNIYVDTYESRVWRKLIMFCMLWNFATSFVRIFNILDFYDFCLIIYAFMILSLIKIETLLILTVKVEQSHKIGI